jgi:hypothetical protein
MNSNIGIYARDIAKGHTLQRVQTSKRAYYVFKLVGYFATLPSMYLVTNM